MKSKIVIIICLFVICCIMSNIQAQGCGPNCPVCSGSGSNTGALVAPKTVILNAIGIPKGDEETGVVNVRGGLTNWLDLGVGYTFKSKKPIWSARIQLFGETEEGIRPAFVFGTGSVQTGGNDQSLFAQLSKSWEFGEIFSMRISAGAASLLPDFSELFGLYSFTFTLFEDWSPFISYDGISYHPGLSWIPTDWLNIGFVLVESKEPAFSFGFRFGPS